MLFVPHTYLRVRELLHTKKFPAFHSEANENCGKMKGDDAKRGAGKIF